MEIRERERTSVWDFQQSTIANSSRLLNYFGDMRLVCVCCCFELNAIFQTKCISDAYSNCFVIPTIWLLSYCYHKFEQLKCLWNGIHAQISQDGFDWSAERCARQKEKRLLESKREKTHFWQTKFKVFCLSHSTHKMKLQLFQTTFNVDLIWQLQNNVHTHNNCIEKFDYIYFLFFVHLVCKVFARKSRKFGELKKKTRAHTKYAKRWEKSEDEILSKTVENIDILKRNHRQSKLYASCSVLPMEPNLNGSQ